MANSPTIIIWRNLPVGSELRLQSDGSLDDYELPVRFTINKVPHPGFEAEDLNPGPATIDIDAIQTKWNIVPTIIVMTKLEKRITLKASVVKDGKVVEVEDGAGGTMPAEAEWRSSRSAGSLFEVFIFARSVTS